MSAPTLLGKAVFREGGYAEWSLNWGSLERYDGRWHLHRLFVTRVTRAQARLELQRAGILGTDGRVTP